MSLAAEFVEVRCLTETVERRDGRYYVHTPGGRVLGPFDTRAQAGMEDMFFVNGADAGDEDELFGEGEPGQGEQPADSSLARRLAKQSLGNKASIALAFRQLWRHKYIEHNYDASQAWKLFYWATTHAGAGGKGFNPATRKAASKLMVSAFSRWAKGDMKAKVKRADGATEKPVGEISRAEFVKWFMGSAPAISESRLHGGFVEQEYGRKPAMVQPKKPEGDTTAFDLEFRVAREQGQTFKTGQPVTFRFMHNKERAPNVGGRFQQDIEPSGYYIIAVDERGIETWKKAGKEFDHGFVTFRNPLVLDWGMAYDQSGWKYRLWKHYDAKKRNLTKFLRRDGYDGIVTVRRGATSEIVALKGKPKMVESLSGMFVEAEDDPKPPKKPPPKKKALKKEPEDDEPEMSDLEKEEEKAEKLGYELKDVQAYYDMKIASGLDQGAALVLTKRKFKVRALKVSPVGKIMSDTIPDPEKLRKKQASQAPPPPPPEEPAGGGDGGEPPTGGTFPEGPKGPQGPPGPPTRGGEE